ncbi:MAG: YdeI/OmpD-associated family protein [Armatimonadetes bacterium]|nr:YdeI/OmpD-associated family protein [Armatimonadota bacterium]
MGQVAPALRYSTSLWPEVVAALDAEPRAKAYFDSLATFFRRNLIRWIEEAKRPATRAERIAEMVRLLGAGKR